MGTFSLFLIGKTLWEPLKTVGFKPPEALYYTNGRRRTRSIGNPGAVTGYSRLLAEPRVTGSSSQMGGPPVPLVSLGWGHVATTGSCGSVWPYILENCVGSQMEEFASPTNSIPSFLTSHKHVTPPRGTTQKAKKKKRKCHVRMSLSQLDKKGSSLLAALLGPRRSVCITELEGRWEPKTSGGTVVFPVHLKWEWA